MYQHRPNIARIPVPVFTFELLYTFFFSDISRLISMGKFEKLCLGQLMAGLKTSEIPWLQHLLSNNLKLHLLAKLIYWIFKHYVFTLLKVKSFILSLVAVKQIRLVFGPN